VSMARSILVLVVLGLLALPAGAGSGDGRAHESVVSGRPAGTLVFASGSNRLTAIDVATGRRTVREVTAVAACGPQMHVTGGHLVFAGVNRGRTIVFSAPVTLDRPPTPLGAAHAFVPSATPGRVWLAGVDCDRSAMVGAREVTVDGHVTQESHRRVPGTWLAAAVPGGLVVQRSRDFVVWSPSTGDTGPPLGLDAVTDAHGSRLAGCEAGSGCRRLAIRDTTTGGGVEPEPASDGEIDIGAAFSPDGSLVAAPIRSGRRWGVVLVDTASGEATAVPGLRSRHYPELSWAASSGWLFARTGARRLLAYRPGLARATVLPVRAPRRAYGFVAG
jgi:hypothetical protein